jgi:heat shock protein HtpX
MVNLHDAVRENERKSLFVLLGFFMFTSLLFAIATTIILSFQGRFTLESFLVIFSIFLIITITYVFYFLKEGDKMILKATGAIEADRKTYPFLYHTTEALSLAAGMRVPPKCYVIKDSALNAYATGFKPEKSYVVVTTGLLEKLNRQELEGVLAHEISHIKNKDIKLMLYVAGLMGVFTLIGTVCYYMMITPSNSKDGDKMKIIFFVLWILFSIIAPFFTLLFKFALSRKREYLADSSGALLTRYPEGLASALEKIKNDPDPLVDHANKATAHLFISTPFRSVSSLFSTHPPIDERIRRLRGQN